MFWNKIKIGVVALFTTVTLGGVGGANVKQPSADGQEIQASAKFDQPKQVNSQAKDDKSAPWALKIEMSLAELAKEQCEFRTKEFYAGKITVDFVLSALSQQLNAERKLATTKAGVIAVYQSHLDRVQHLEQVCRAKYEVRAKPVTDTENIMKNILITRVEAEIWLEEAKAAK